MCVLASKRFICQLGSSLGWGAEIQKAAIYCEIGGGVEVKKAEYAQNLLSIRCELLYMMVIYVND